MYFRPGASSGILVGALTLPSVMLSKLIQMSRAVSLKEVEIEGTNSMFLSPNFCFYGALELLVRFHSESSTYI